MKESKIKKDNAFAEKLKSVLDDNGITMTQLANDTGITYNMVKKYCHGMAEPTISYALKIAETLNVSIDWLMGYEPVKKNDMFREVFEQDVTYIAGFMRTVRKLPGRVAMVDPIEEREWTYAQLNEDVNMLANALLRNGVNKKDIVFYQLPNSKEFVFSYLAPQKIGAITSPANPNFSPGETVVCLENNKPKVYIYDESIKEMAVTALELSSYRPEIVLMAGDGEVPEGHARLSDFTADGTANEPETDFVPNIYEEVMRLFTSGTTGKPKGVPVTNANEVMTCHDVIMHFPMNSTDTTMNMTPWFHRGGIHSGGPAPTFYAGGRVIILRNFQPQIALKYTEKYGITFLIGVPSVIKMLVRIQERFKADLSSLRGIVTMGAPFERADCIKVQEVLTKNIFNGYGTTESFWNTFLRPYDLPEMSGTAGRSCTDDEVRIVKLGGEPDDLVAMDSVDTGEIIIRTPKSSYCYHDNPEEEKKKFYKGWIYTGDIGTWDKNQYITVAGRKDDMLISGGENIYPPIIEEVLNEHPKVHQSAVTGVPDTLRGEAVTAYIVADDESLTVGELARYCLNSPMLSTFKRPRYYRFVKELPLTATGKLQHYLVKEMALNDLELGLLKLAIADEE
ncbi:MAG: AMP-binding protein [Anaerovoracaceae bacterium]